MHEALAAKLPAAPPALTSGQVVSELLSSLKLLLAVGLLPLDGSGNLSGRFPRFVTVTAWAVLASPTAVLGKVRVGGAVRSPLALDC